MGTCCGQLARGRTHTYTVNAGIAYVYEENTLRDAIAGAEPSLLSPVGFLLRDVMACGAFSIEMGQQKAGRTHVSHLQPLTEKSLDPREQGETPQ